MPSSEGEPRPEQELLAAAQRDSLQVVANELADIVSQFEEDSLWPTTPSPDALALSSEQWQVRRTCVLCHDGACLLLTSKLPCWQERQRG